MKLIKKTVSVLALLFVVFAMTGCTQILGKLLDKGADKLEEQNNNTPDPETPNITSEDEGYSFKVHYGAPITLTIKAEVADKGVLTYQWYSSSTDKREDATPITGTTDAEKLAVKTPIYAAFAPAAPEKDGIVTYYWCKVTNTSLKTGKTKENWSDGYAITVSNIERVHGYIDSTTVWNPLYTYYVDGWITIEKSLTIPAGTVVKCGKDADICTTGTGTIAVTGSKDYPVYFTSYLDESVGIKIPEFVGSATKAAKGDWKGIRIDGAQGSTFTYTTFRYSNEYALKLNKKANVANCVFTNNKSDENYSGALTIYTDAKESVVINNTFYNNDWPLTVSKDYTVDTSNIFHNPADVTVKNKYQAIILTSGNYINATGAKVDWMVTELPYYMVDSWLNVTKGTLNIGDNTHNVVVKFTADAEIYADQMGSITLGVGSILTSWKDDAHGGDIEADGQLIDPEWGDWAGIRLYGSDWNNAINKDTDRVLYNDKSKYQED